jgi:hypothetical protein
MLDEVFLVHANAGVGDSEGFIGLVQFKVDARRIDAIPNERPVLVVGEAEVTQLVERVRGVGDELAEEDLRVRIERMDDQLEELGDFGLKFLLGHNLDNYGQKGGEMKISCIVWRMRLFNLP